MKKPLVSVIVPVFNAEKYLEECVNSLLAQTLDDIEIILVDDGSTDGSAGIAKRYVAAEPEKVRYTHGPNAGQSAARNRGLDMASGRYISFCDADDTYMPDALPAMAKALDSDNECDIVTADFIQGAAAPERGPGRVSFTLVTALEAIENTLYQKAPFHPSVCAKLYRAELFHYIRFTPGLYYEDLEITPRLYYAARNIAVTGAKLYFYRRNPDSFINTWHPRRLDTLEATARILDFIGKNLPEAEPAARSRRYSANLNMFAEAVRHNDTALEERCFAVIKSDRRAILADPKVRFKNKAAAAASCLGRVALRLCCKAGV